MSRFLHFFTGQIVLLGFAVCSEVKLSENTYVAYHGNANDSHSNYKSATLFTTFAAVDRAADQYASTKQIYNYQEAIQLRTSLHQQLEANSNNLALNWALMRFYASAPNFVGGSTSTALQFAGYIFSLNQYLGCLAFEYVYTKRKDPDSAEQWYKKSLNVPLARDMYWEEIAYNKTPQTSIKVTGNFNNWKTQNMYATLSGTFKRKVMVPKCESCIYKVIVDYNQISTPSTKQLTGNFYW